MYMDNEFPPIGEEVQIPIGWRKLYPQEVRRAGDKYYANKFWHNASMIGQVIGKTDLVFIRAINSTAPNPNEHSFERINSTFVPTISVSDKVKNYLKKTNGQA